MEQHEKIEKERLQRAADWRRTMAGKTNEEITAHHYKHGTMVETPTLEGDDVPWAWQHLPEQHRPVSKPVVPFVERFARNSREKADELIAAAKTATTLQEFDAIVEPFRGVPYTPKDEKRIAEALHPFRSALANTPRDATSPLGTDRSAPEPALAKSRGSSERERSKK